MMYYTSKYYYGFYFAEQTSAIFKSFIKSTYRSSSQVGSITVDVTVGVSTLDKQKKMLRIEPGILCLLVELYDKQT